MGAWNQNIFWINLRLPFLIFFLDSHKLQFARGMLVLVLFFRLLEFPSFLHFCRSLLFPERLEMFCLIPRSRVSLRLGILGFLRREVF